MCASHSCGKLDWTLKVTSVSNPVKNMQWNMPLDYPTLKSTLNVITFLVLENDRKSRREIALCIMHSTFFHVVYFEKKNIWQTLLSTRVEYSIRVMLSML